MGGGVKSKQMLRICFFLPPSCLVFPLSSIDYISFVDGALLFDVRKLIFEMLSPSPCLIGRKDPASF